MVDIRLLNADSPLWPELLADQRHDFYHLPGYVQLCAEMSQGRAAAFHMARDGARMFVPVILHGIPGEAAGDCCDAASPYGYPGPLLQLPAQWTAAESAGFMREAITAMIALMRSMRLVSAFIRLHPLLPLAPGLLLEFGQLVHHGDTVSIDLRADEAMIWGQLRGNHRSGINRSVRNGHLVEFDSRLEHLEVFIAAYDQTMVRVGAKPGYYFPPDYYRKLWQALSGRLHLVLVRVAGQPASVALFTEVDGIVQYHLGGTFDEHLHLQTHKLLFHRAALWAKERGNRSLHLGGGLGGGNDSLFHFKAGFSRLRHAFHTWRLITDADAYRRLSQRTAAHEPGAQDGAADFFPAYRRQREPSPDGAPPGPRPA
jgi:hypothetical protein